MDCTLSLVHMSNMNFNTGKVNVVSAVSRIQADLIEQGVQKKISQQNRQVLKHMAVVR